MQLTADIHTWAVRQIGQIAAVEKLKGSTSTTLLLLTAADGQQYVLRLYDNLEWVAEEPGLARHEAAALRRAVSAPVATPRLIAFDEASSPPVLLMSRLPGAVWLTPTDQDDWLRQMAETLIGIHRLPPVDFPWDFFCYTALDTLAVPRWSRWPDHWHEAIRRIHAPAPAYTPAFIHRDYHPVNLLWQDGRISGVVDWPNACIGAAGLDVGHMRVDLSKLYGIEAANRFLQHYQAAGGSYHPHWDLIAIADTILYDEHPPYVYQPWVEFGLTGLTEALMIERADSLLLDVLHRFSTLDI